MRRTEVIGAMILLASCRGQEAGPGVGADRRPNDSVNAKVTDRGTQPDASEIRNSMDADPGSVSPCLMQGNDRLTIKPFRAIGTEPFWSARVEGRCVTYSTPEDQQGTRVWTRYSPGPESGGTWVGQLSGKPFELKTRAEPGCSDGMSDNRYPMAAELTVSGEQRRGCAEPL